MPRPEHLAGQRLRRRPDKCDAGRRRHKLHITRFRRCRRRKLAHSAVPPLPTETASLGFGGNPIQGGDKSSRKRNLCAYGEQHPLRKNLPFTAEKQDVSSAGFQGNFLPPHSAIPTFLRGGITTLGVCFMLSKRRTRRGHGGLIAPCRVLSLRRLCERTQRLTRANRGRFHRP